MQLDSIKNCKKKKKAFFVAKIEDYNLTKQKYFECKIYILHIAYRLEKLIQIGRASCRERV